MFATHKSHMECGYGQQRYSNGHQTQRALACLAAICGRVGKEDGNYNFIDSMGFPTLGDNAFANAGAVAVPEGAEIKNTRMLNIARIANCIHEAKDPPIKAVIAYRGGLISQQGNVDYTIEAVKSLDLFVSIEQFMTDDTAKIPV